MAQRNYKAFYIKGYTLMTISASNFFFVDDHGFGWFFLNHWFGVIYNTLSKLYHTPKHNESMTIISSCVLFLQKLNSMISSTNHGPSSTWRRRSKSLKRKKEKMAKDYPENNTIVSSQARSIQEVNKAKC